MSHHNVHESSVDALPCRGHVYAGRSDGGVIAWVLFDRLGKHTYFEALLGWHNGKVTGWWFDIEVSCSGRT